MKDAYEVLKQKEADLARVRHEVESLRMAATLLVEDLNESNRPHLMSTDDLLGIVRKSDPDSQLSGSAGHLFSSILRKRA